MAFSADFVTHAVLGDWVWVDAAAQRGFLYLDATKAPSADGLLIQFCKKLSACAGPGLTAERIGQAREALNHCADSWASSVKSGRPWDASIVLLNLCVYAFERVVNDSAPSVMAVNRALLGPGR